MFEQLLSRRFDIRHYNGPYSEERQRYLASLIATQCLSKLLDGFLCDFLDAGETLHFTYTRNKTSCWWKGGLAGGTTRVGEAIDSLGSIVSTQNKASATTVAARGIPFSMLSH
jgi:hypothetical protein